MILMNMSADEILRHLEKDRLTLDATADIKTEEFRKILKKYPRTRYRTNILHCRPTMQDYILTLHIFDRSNKRSPYQLKWWAIVNDNGKKLYITKMNDNQDVEIHTQHFFDRYRERTHREHLTVAQAAAEFLENSKSMAIVYQKDDKGVYATPEGLCLCNMDNDDKIWFRTFVSTEMLKATQSAAWEKVQAQISALNEFVNKNSGTIPMLQYRARRDMLTRTFEKLNDEAEEIYKQYYE